MEAQGQVTPAFSSGPEVDQGLPAMAHPDANRRGPGFVWELDQDFAVALEIVADVIGCFL
jgi:hypothetical protein